MAIAPALFELRPDRNLLTSDFNGYKLSLEKIPILKVELATSVDRVLPNSEQYSLLHTKLFALHNHLFSDLHNEAVYFVDKNWEVGKIIFDEETGRLSDISKVWVVPKLQERKSGHYNASLLFPTSNIAVLSDGCGSLHILNTGNRNEIHEWKTLFSDSVLDSDNGFIIQDAIYKTNDKGLSEINCLLVNVERAESCDKFVTVINWITLNESSDHKWGETCIRVLKASGGFYYCGLEPNCKYIYIASDKSFKFTLDSENPISDDKQISEQSTKVYTWSQTEDTITVRFNVNPKCDKRDLTININPTNLIVKHKNIVLLHGELTHRLFSELTTSDIKTNILEITVAKYEKGQHWSSLIQNDESGEQIIDLNLVAKAHERLAHLCSDTEMIPSESGPSFSTQQIEECDFEGDNTAIFERFYALSHDVTHRTNLGSHQVIMSVKLDANKPASIVIRHDVDACIWSPQETEEWSLKHEGTLLAFGYVQASKQQRKFSSCAPDLNYSVVCETSRHLFIYRQNRTVLSGELRNRRSGQRVGKIAEQQVISLENDEVLGLVATNNVLYLLTGNSLQAFKISTEVV